MDKKEEEILLRKIGVQKKRKTKPKKVETFNFLETIKNLIFGIQFSFLYITIDNKKRIILFLIGCSTIILVCCIMALLQNLMRKVPLIFIRISEDTTGEADIYILPSFTNSSQNVFLNSTSIAEKLSNNDLIIGSSPRWMFPITIKARDDEDGEHTETAIMLLTDTQLEEDMEIGRNWPYRKLGEMECHVKSNVLYNIGVEPNYGQRVTIALKISSLLGDDQEESLANDEGVFEDDDDDSSDSDSNALNETIINFLDTFGLNSTDKIDDNGVDFLEFIGVEDAEQYANKTWYFFMEDFFNQTTTINDISDLVNINLEAEFIVVDSVIHTFGKYPTALGNIVVVDSRYIATMMEAFLSSDPVTSVLIDTMLDSLDDSDSIISFDFRGNQESWYENAMMLVAMYSERFSTYRLRDDEKEKALIELTNSIMEDVGFNESLSLTLPTAEGLVIMDMVGMFLDQIFVAMTICLSALGTILIFSLLLSNVEEKTYEYGMLRAMGLQQPSLIEMTFIQAFYFAVPGIIISFILAYIFNIPLDYCFYYFINLPEMDWTFSWDAILLPLGLGLLIPFVSNIIPVRTALGKSLRNSLDITRQSQNETKVRFTKLENVGLEAWQFAIAIVMIVFGFVVYYVMPLSFIFDQMNIFMYTLELIFIGMLAGLCVIAVQLQPYIERIILEVFLFFNFVFPKDRRMRTLIIKNLAGHRSRSRKTFLMFTLTVAFVVFSGVNLRQLISVFTGNLGLLTGSHINVQSTTSTYNIRSPEIDEFLENQKEIGNLTDYAYITFELSSTNFVRYCRFSNLAIYPRESVHIYAVTENFLEAAFDEYYIPTETNTGLVPPLRGTDPDLIAALYGKGSGKPYVSGLKDGYEPEVVYSGRRIGVSEEDYNEFDPGASYEESYNVIIGEACRDYFGITSDSAALFSIRLENGYYEKFIAKPIGMVSKMPGFFFSSYAVAAIEGSAIMSVSDFERLVKSCHTRLGWNEKKYEVDEILYQTLLLKMPGNNDDDHRKVFTNKLRNYIDPDLTSILDVEDLMNSMYGAVIGFTALQYTAGGLSLIFCTYMLALSFISNVRDNSWEFGVLRATGFNANMLIRSYIYEAMILVVSAFTLGTLVGAITGSTLIAQFNLFLEMPFTFDFPFDLVFGMGGVAVILAIFGSYFPSKVIKEREIAQVLRGIV